MNAFLQIIIDGSVLLYRLVPLYADHVIVGFVGNCENEKGNHPKIWKLDIYTLEKSNELINRLNENDFLVKNEWLIRRVIGIDRRMERRMIKWLFEVGD